MTDPYLDDALCEERLLREHRQHGRLIVAVDFDDTVFDFHKAGHTYDEVLSLLRRCNALGFYVVIFTGGGPEAYAGQKAYLEEQGVSVAAVNQNPIPLPFGNHGKIYYNILLDDRAGLGQAVSTLNVVITAIEHKQGAINEHLPAARN